MSRLFLLSLFSTFCLVSCRDARIHDHPEWGKYYEQAGIKSAGFILRDQTHDAVHYYNLNHDTTHYMPASTFKIVLSLVALELGVVQDDKFIIPWDGIVTGRPDRDRDLTLREAFEVSSESYFKEVARRIGKERLQQALDTIRYGNKIIGDSVANCWTDNSLKISADEQVGFVRRLYFNQLPYADRSQRIVRSLMLRETANNRKLYYKTGWGENDTAHVLWAVGFAEYEMKVKEDKASMNKSDVRNYVYFFAQNFEIPQSDTGKNWADDRLHILNQVLADYTAKNHQ